MRQNTPHPKELKAKAHKLFSKDKRDEEMSALSEEVSVTVLLLKQSCSTDGAALCLGFEATRNINLVAQHKLTQHFPSQQSQRNDVATTSTSPDAAPVVSLQQLTKTLATVVHTENQNSVTSPNFDVSSNVISRHGN